ncbi:MAG: pyridoxamine 5'-phosphate oxidase family protein [Caldilineaceae bacterium]|nr:pyridoxamine 5'-phosphate oxidase family protein [Caldilineaceae bacterium]
MPTQQGDLALLNDPIAQELLHSRIPARVAYVWTDGTPRVVPIWFHWNGEQIVLGSPVEAPKVHALRQNPKVAVTIDDNNWPHKVLLIRGSATVEIVDGVVPEYAASAARYFGAEQGEAWVGQVKGLVSQMARVVIQPEWVAILDFEQRFPNALERAMGM